LERGAAFAKDAFLHSQHTHLQLFEQMRNGFAFLMWATLYENHSRKNISELPWALYAGPVEKNGGWKERELETAKETAS
jgi:hypothetical protein